jgi:hypothetical protein
MNTTVLQPTTIGAPENRFTSGPAIVLYLALAKLAFHLLTAFATRCITVPARSIWPGATLTSLR